MRHHFALMAPLIYLLFSATYVCATGVDGDGIAESKLAKSINEFAFALYKAIKQSVDGGNIFMSPASISTALTMVYLGARGDTRKQMTSAMHLDVYNSSDETSLKNDIKTLINTLSSEKNNYTLYVANRLFGQEGFSFRDEFLQDTVAYFKATLETLDFIKDPSGSRDHINDWVEEQTSEKIRDLLPDGSITTTTRLVLVNAIYFKGLWSIPFDPQATKPETFYLSSSENTKVDMMHLAKKRLNYYNSTELGCQVVELPYLGDQASMFILLPHDSIRGLSLVESRLGADSLDQIFSNLKGFDVKLRLPKFTMELSVELGEFLRATGMVDMFDKLKANLSGIDGSTDLFVSEVFHKAVVEVNEEGTEAAAATGAVVSFRSLAVDETIAFDADRPFLFMIVEKRSGCVLFLGRLTQPPIER